MTALMRFVAGDFFVASLLAITPPRHFSRYPNRRLASRASSGVGAFTLGNLSRQCQGRHALMMARLLVKSPAALRSGSMRGSSGVEHPLWMMSIGVVGSER